MNIDVLSEKVDRFQNETIYGIDHCALITICVAPDGLSKHELVRLSPHQLMATIAVLDEVRAELIRLMMTGGEHVQKKPN